MTRRLNSSPPAFAEPKSGVRVAVDSLVQASLVDLFTSYGVALAPLPRSQPMELVLPDVSVAAAFRCNGGAGRLTLSVPNALLEHMRQAEVTSIRLDWARELTNQLLGRVKNRLLPFGVRLEMGGLTLLDRNLLKHQLQDSTEQRVYLGRTLRGVVLATVQGVPADSTLSYVGGVTSKEGALLWL